MSTSSLDPLWRRILDPDTPDPAAATRFIDEALRAFPDLSHALATAPHDSPYVLRGSHRCLTQEELERLRGVRVLLGHLEVAADLPDLSPLHELTFVQHHLLLRGRGALPDMGNTLSLQALTAVGGRLELSCHPDLSHLDLTQLGFARDVLVYDVPLAHLRGLSHLRRCDSMRLLLEPETVLDNTALPALHTRQLLVLRYIPNADRWYLRRLYSGEARRGWQAEAARRDGLSVEAIDGRLDPADGALRPAGSLLIGLLGCNFAPRGRFLLPLFDGHNVIGRRSDNGISFHCNVLHPRHLNVRHEAGITTLLDFGGANGTWQHGKQISRSRLSSGDAFQFARVQATFWEI